MNNIKMLSALLAATVLLTACSGDDDSDSQEQQNVMLAGKTYFMSVKADKSNNGSAAARATRALDANLNASWDTNDTVFIRDKDNNVRFEGSLTPDQNGTTAWLNGNISPTVPLELPIDVTLIFPKKEWSYESQKGTIADIAANYDFATATAKITQVDGDNVGAATSVNFANQQAIVKFTLCDKDNSNASLLASSLRISSKGLQIGEEDTGDITITPATATSEFYAALRGVSGSPRVTLTATVPSEGGTDTYIYNNVNGITFHNGSYYPITVKMHKVTYPVALANVTDDYIGSVVGQNGNVYPSAEAATAARTTAVAMVAYVGTESNCTHGLAIALADESSAMNQNAMNQNDAIETASSKTEVTSETWWRLPTMQDWKYMLIGCGNGENPSTSSSVDCSALNSKLATVGTALNNDGSCYWSSSNYNCPQFLKAEVDLSMADGNNGYSLHYVRACLSF